MELYAMKLNPYISETIWGGKRLIEEYGIVTEKDNAAEGWMLSCHESGLCTVENGCFGGKTLREIWSETPEIIGSNGRKFSDFPILIKFIDARDDLSVQVHPTAEYCALTGKGQSKTECWYVLDTLPGASLLMGFNKEISTEEFRASIEEGRVTDNVKRYDVKKGDFFFIESGTLHAICKGVLLAEVQESSNTTYRIFDYNRPGKDGKPRELHVEDAVAVTKCVPYVPSEYCRNDTVGDEKHLADCPLFKVSVLDIDGIHDEAVGEDSFVSLLILSGDGELVFNNCSYPLTKGDSYFIPACIGSFSVKGKCEILKTKI